LRGSFGKNAPSQPEQVIAALPRPKDPLDTGAHSWKGRLQASIPMGVSASSRPPHACRNNVRRADPGPHGFTETVSAIDAVGKLLVGTLW
jgi:hypothetical protein